MTHFLLHQAAGLVRCPQDAGGKDESFTYVQELRIAEFLEQGMKLKKDFLMRVEEEHRQEEA